MSAVRHRRFARLRVAAPTETDPARSAGPIGLDLDARTPPNREEYDAS